MPAVFTSINAKTARLVSGNVRPIMMAYQASVKIRPSRALSLAFNRRTAYFQRFLSLVSRSLSGLVLRLINGLQRADASHAATTGLDSGRGSSALSRRLLPKSPLSPISAREAHTAVFGV